MLVPPQPETLQFHLLGGIQVIRAGQAQSGFISAKARALLIYLVLSRRPQSRDSLAGLLWGDLPDADAKANLRQALANLRRLTGDYVQADRETVSFSFDRPHWLDVAEFERLLAEGRFADAVGLYQGDFLAGFHVREAGAFEEWAVVERERLRQAVSNALENLVAEHTARGEFSAGVDYARRRLALDPWREEVHRQLMLLLAHSGERSAALAQFEACRRLLEQELGVQPSAETVRLRDRLQAAARARPRQLPSLAPLIGRAREQTEIAHTLAPGATCRLLTVLGPGGIGKTRLAQQAVMALGDAFINGAYLVPLASVTSADWLPGNIAIALGVTFSGSRDERTQILQHLRNLEVLLVLDNYEHLIEGGSALVAEILRDAPDVKLLVTSRERLNLRAERLLELAGLSVPPQAAEVLSPLEGYAAVQLFLSSARGLQPNYAPSPADWRAIARLCRLVEGMPLAIELAAAWVRTMTAEQIAAEIEQDVDFLATTLRDVAERHRSLRTAVEHSWRRLNAEEQTWFRRLSVFRNGLTREAAEAVTETPLNALAALIDKSLVRRQANGRYEVHELLRQYGEERLIAEPVDAHQTSQRHSEYFGEFVRQREPALKGAEQRQAAAELEVEIENVRRGWQWALSQGSVADIDRYLSSLARFYELRGWFHEGALALGQAIAALEDVRYAASDSERRRLVLARALGRQASFCFRLDRYDDARRLSQAALDNLPAEEPEAKAEAAFCLNTLGNTAWALGDNNLARQLHQQCLALRQAAGDAWGIGAAHYAASDPETITRAKRLFEPLQARLTPKQRSAALAAGHGATLEAAAELALSLVAPPKYA